MLESAKAVSNSVFDNIDETFSHFAPVKRLAEKASIRPSYILLSFFLITVLLLGTGIFSHLCVTLFGMLYPSFMTYKVLLG